MLEDDAITKSVCDVEEARLCIDIFPHGVVEAMPRKPAFVNVDVPEPPK